MRICAITAVVSMLLLAGCGKDRPKTYMNCFGHAPDPEVVVLGDAPEDSSRSIVRIVGTSVTCTPWKSSIYEK